MNWHFPAGLRIFTALRRAVAFVQIHVIGSDVSPA